MTNQKTTGDNQLAMRIREVIGDESVSSFGRKCSIGESAIRKYLAGSLPNSENLVKVMGKNY